MAYTPVSAGPVMVIWTMFPISFSEDLGLSPVLDVPLSQFN